MAERSPTRRHQLNLESKEIRTNVTPSRSKEFQRPSVTHSQVEATDISGRPLKQRNYIHLRDKPDFLEEGKSRRKAEGTYKYMNDIPFDTKLEESAQKRRGRKMVPTSLAQHGIPLKGALPDEPGYKKQKRKIDMAHQPSQRQERGKRTYGDSNTFKRSVSERRLAGNTEVPRETVEYIRLQLDKQWRFDKTVEKAAKWRRTTPDERNKHLMQETINYGFANFVKEKLTPKVTDKLAADARSHSASHRRSHSHYGKRCKPFLHRH